MNENQSLNNSTSEAKTATRHLLVQYITIRSPAMLLSMISMIVSEEICSQTVQLTCYNCMHRYDPWPYIKYPTIPHQIMTSLLDSLIIMIIQQVMPGIAYEWYIEHVEHIPNGIHVCSWKKYMNSCYLTCLRCLTDSISSGSGKRFDYLMYPHYFIYNT